MVRFCADYLHRRCKGVVLVFTIGPRRCWLDVYLGYRVYFHENETVTREGVWIKRPDSPRVQTPPVSNNNWPEKGTFWASKIECNFRHFIFSYPSEVGKGMLFCFHTVKKQCLKAFLLLHQSISLSDYSPFMIIFISVSILMRTSAYYVTIFDARGTSSAYNLVHHEENSSDHFNFMKI